MASTLFKTPDEYLLQVIARIQALGSRLTDFNAGSVTRTLFEGHSAALSTHSLVADQLRADSYLASATGDALDRKSADYQVTRKAAQVATGTVRLTRQATGSAISVPAGFGELATVPVPGAQSITFTTTEDAVFATTDTFKVVKAVATIGGAAGNIAATTKLLPINPVSGFATDGGFVAETTFGSGVDAETDDALRSRVPIEVQGRVKGTPSALLAAALRTPGVLSAAVLKAGDARADATLVAANNAEVYYEGSSSLASAVGSEVANATIAGQNVTTFNAAADRAVVNLTVFALAGVDGTVLSAAVRNAVKATIGAAPVGVTVRSAAIIQAVQATPGVVSQTIPYADLRKFTAAGGTFGDLVPGSTKYADLQDADITVAVSFL